MKGDGLGCIITMSVHKHFENFDVLCVINNLHLVTVNVTASVIL